MNFKELAKKRKKTPKNKKTPHPKYSTNARKTPLMSVFHFTYTKLHKFTELGEIFKAREVVVVVVVVVRLRVYLGTNRSYSSKPGHLLFTAYVSMSMWFSS